MILDDISKIHDLYHSAFANEPPVRLRVDISAEFCWHLSKALPLTLSSHKFPHLTLIRMCHMVVALKKPS